MSDKVMPRPLGRDRLEPSTDGTVVLLSLQPKPWRGREEASPGTLERPGTAVRWEDELFEVLRTEPRETGGFRHVLAPWDERLLVRSYVEYGAEDRTGHPVPRATSVAGAEVSTRGGPATGLASRWARSTPAVRGLILGFVPAVLLGWFFPFRIMGEGMSFLVHELGHTVTAWLFGCTALPAIVMTIRFEQSRAVAALVWVALVYSAVRFRHAPRWNVFLGTIAALYPFVAFTRAHITAFDLGGHLAEVLVAAWAFRIAVETDRPDWERPVYSFFAFYLVGRNVRLFGGVAVSASARSDYLTIAIADQNDLVKVAAATGISLPTLAAVTAIVFVIVPLTALVLAFRSPEPARV